MKKIVIIGANEFQKPLIEKAEKMGYETHVFAWKSGAVGAKSASYFYPISITEKEKILDKCKKIKPDAVVTIASELANITVNYLSHQLGLICNSERCLEITTNKFLMRKALKESGLYTPRFVVVSEDEESIDKFNDFNMPVIVKPTDRSGSRGIFKVNSIDKIIESIKASINNSFEKKVIVEEYIEGNEYSCESISYKGVHKVLAITKKYTTGAPHFIEIGHIEPADIDEKLFESISKQISASLDALEIEYGASHAEFKLSNNGEVRIIEIGSRMGGDCIGSDLVFNSTGYDFLEYVIDVAAGNEPSIIRKHNPMASGIRFIFNQEDIDVYTRLKNLYPKNVVYVSEIDEIGKREVTDSSTRFGYYIVVGNNKEEVTKLLSYENK